MIILNYHRLTYTYLQTKLPNVLYVLESTMIKPTGLEVKI